MRYKVTHVTEYFYGEQVPLCHNLIRLRPRDTASQKCVRHDLTIDPMPAIRRDRIDFFGNHVTWIALQQTHERLKIKAFSEVEISAHSIPDAANEPAWEAVVAMLAGRIDPLVLAVREYTFDSPHVAADPALAEYARPSFPAAAPLLGCLMNLNKRIHAEFKFESGVTTIRTPVLEVLRHRRGVCQDFAHLAIGCLRSLGLAARYVSGYVATKPAPGQPRLMGADASHAWFSAFVPEHGWVDFDPTNGLLPAGEHVTVGWARDYYDLSPVKGVMIGGDRHSLRYSVDVEPQLETADAKLAANS